MAKDADGRKRDVFAKARAWELRQRGKTLATIAREIGVDRSNVVRWLAEIERRELARLSTEVERKKVLQDGVLEHVLEESLEAWERSKAPRTRIRETKGPDEPILDANGNPVIGPDGKPVMAPGQKITEVVQQTGDVHYVDRALQALAELRKLWGLNVAEKANDNGPGSFAERVKALKARADRFEAREPDAEPPEADEA